MDQSLTEIKSWERALIDRTRGQIADLELKKQHFLKHAQLDKVSAIKKRQRAILLQLEKDRAKLKKNSERSSMKVEEVPSSSLVKLDKSISSPINEYEARDNIER